MIRVVTVEDHAVVRSGLARLINDDPGMQVIAEASDTGELMRIIRSDVQFDLLLMDVNLKGTISLEALKTVKALLPHVRCLILSMYPEKQYALRFIKAGASGYITKDSAADELIIALRKVASGKRYVTESLAEILLSSEVENDGAPAHGNLSDREFEVMLGIARGKRIRDIAAELSLSDKTVSTYRSRILEKLNCSNNAAIVEYAMSHDLVHK